MAKTPKTAASEEDVIAFLRRNRAFFREHPGLFDLMDLPGRDHGAGVVDFQTRLLDKLRADQVGAEARHRDLVEIARANMHNQNRVYTAVLVLLEADSFEELVSVITQDFPILLDVDTVNLVIETTTKEVPFVSNAQFRFARQGTVNKWLGEGDALLQDNIEGPEEIFGPAAGLVKSHALMRLEISPATPAGIIAFGSRDPQAFQPNQAIDQAGFLAQVVERCFRIWLDVHH